MSVGRPAPATASGLLVGAVALGGAIGAMLRWAGGELVPDGDGFAWTTFAINVLGSALLALLLASIDTAHRPYLAAGLGPGVLGGFTTLSTYAGQGRALLAGADPWVGVAYLLGTLLACVGAVLLVTWAVRRGQGRRGQGREVLG